LVHEVKRIYKQQSLDDYLCNGRRVNHGKYKHSKVSKQPTWKRLKAC
jgi:hypothetical protein